MSSTPTPFTQLTTVSSRLRLERGLVDVVLVLADADGLRVDLHQLGERVHQAAADGDGAADGEVVVRELLAGDVGGGVDGGAALVDHHDRDGGGELERADEGLGLAAGGAVADGDGLDVELLHQRGDLDGGFVASGSASRRWR